MIITALILSCTALVAAGLFWGRRRAAYADMRRTGRRPDRHHSWYL